MAILSYSLVEKQERTLRLCIQNISKVGRILHVLLCSLPIKLL